MAHRHHSGERATTDNLKLYLREIARIAPLTPEEELELGRRAQQGDTEAIKKLVESNLRFVVAYAKKYRNMNVNFMDLINAGNLGLIEAARRYDPEKNLRFITYAVWWIRQAIFSSLSSQSRAFSVPQRVANILHRIGQSERKLTHELSREPSSSEIATSLDMTDDEIDSLLNLDAKGVSLTQQMNDEDSRELEQMLDVPQVDPVENSMIRESMIQQIGEVLQELDPREREVISLRFGLDGNDPKTLKEVGDQLNISRERVRQIEAKAKQKLRHSHKFKSLLAYLN
ncbi:MAG: sigma-70 family RNA polymerase sigma factor [Acidobacteria bacterium]|nr:sigma-70 family RNA polymerase sigma factor [Acidobacteriota bacterium]